VEIENDIWQILKMALSLKNALAHISVAYGNELIFIYDTNMHR
jgi:hypothetical protein